MTVLPSKEAMEYIPFLCFALSDWSFRFPKHWFLFPFTNNTFFKTDSVLPLTVKKKCGSPNSIKHMRKSRKRSVQGSQILEAVETEAQFLNLQNSEQPYNLFLLPPLSPHSHTHISTSSFWLPTLFPVPLPTGGWHSAACRIVQSIISISALSCLSVKAEI